MKFGSANVKEVGRLVQSGRSILLLDVRSPSEFRTVRAKVAANLPLDQGTPARVESMLGPTSADKPLYVICKAGGRSRSACEMLTTAGMTNIINVDGGTDAWVAAGLPVEHG